MDREALRQSAKDAVPRWSDKDRAGHLIWLQKEGYITICERCCQRLIFSVARISEYVKKEFQEHDIDSQSAEYWVRIGWCEGYGLGQNFWIASTNQMVCQECYEDQEDEDYWEEWPDDD